MDRNFYIDSFERLLKEKSDEFRMYPTKKVWNSIYNNLYPGRRWPSAIVSLAIISSLSLVSFLNTNHIKTSELLLNHNNSRNNSTIKPASTLIDKMSSTSIIYNENKKNTKSKTLYTKAISIPQQYSFVNVSPTIKNNITLLVANNASSNIDILPIKQNNIEVKTLASATKESPNYYSSINDHFAKKAADKLVLQIYASPYVAYGEVAGPKINSAQDNNGTFDNSSIGLEAGTAMQYSLSGLIKLKAGVQFNYASYNMEAYQNDMNNDMADIIPKTPGFSPVTLHNEMYQFSLPVGLEFKLLKNNNLQWNAGATIQPTFIAGGNTYLLSSDSHSFIDESSAINKWNFNAGFETFITYKVKGLTWQFGPQMRYQFYSIYSKAYTAIDEKLVNFGVKIGISKVLR